MLEKEDFVKFPSFFCGEKKNRQKNYFKKLPKFTHNFAFNYAMQRVVLKVFYFHIWNITCQILVKFYFGLLTRGILFLNRFGVCR